MIIAPTIHILEIIKKNIFPHTFCVLKNSWENIFLRPEEAMFENWQKLVPSNKKLILFMKKSLTTLLKQDEKSSLTCSY